MTKQLKNKKLKIKKRKRKIKSKKKKKIKIQLKIMLKKIKRKKQPKKSKVKKNKVKEHEKEDDKEKDKDKDEKPKKKEKNTTKKYIKALLAKVEKELFKSNPQEIPENQVEENRKRINQTKILDNNKIYHYFLKKGTDININEYDIFPIQKVKKQGGVLSKLNLGLNIKFGGINKMNLFKNKKKM